MPETPRMVRFTSPDQLRGIAGPIVPQYVGSRHLTAAEQQRVQQIVTAANVSRRLR